MRNRRAARITAAFFAAMLVLTFCSRTIYRSTLPRVRVETAAGGVLSYRFDLSNFEIRAEEYVYAYLPFLLERALTIEKVWVRPGDAVQTGDALVSFYAPEGEYLLSSANAAVQSAGAALAYLESAIASARLELSNRLDGRQARAQAEAIRAEIARLDAGFCDGQSAAHLRGALLEAQERAQALAALQECGWTLFAQHAGTVCSVSAAEGAAYGGLSPLCALPAQGQEVYLHAVLEGAPDLSGALWNVSALLQTDGGALQAEAVPAGAGAVRILPAGSCAPGEILSLTIYLQSPYQQNLLPLQAVQGNRVFVLETGTGDWGQTVYTARETRVASGETDGTRIAILDGLHPGDRIIVSSTEAITDGQIVLPQGFALP